VHLATCGSAGKDCPSREKWRRQVESGPRASAAPTCRLYGDDPQVEPLHQKIEEGAVNLTIRTLERLCRAFGVDVRELFAS
jgi:hypothetical protein